MTNSQDVGFAITDLTIRGRLFTWVSIDVSRDSAFLRVSVEDVLHILIESRL